MACRSPAEIAAAQNLNALDDDPQSEFERSFLAFLNNNSPIWAFTDSHEELEPAETATVASTSRFSRLTSLGSRLRNNHHHHHQQNRSTSSRTSLSSAPVLVRAYTGPRSRDVSRARSLADSFLSSSAMRGNHAPSALPNGAASLARTSIPEVKLPPVSDFAFDGILRAVEPEIQDALDAIAEICARSRMSMANAHGAHLPPTGEITAPQALPQPRVRHWGLGIRTDVERMTSVPEVNSSSGSASKASSASGLGRKRSAMGSLRGIMSRSKEGSEAGPSKERSELSKRRNASWVVVEDQRHPSIVLVAHALASKKLSLDTVTELPLSEPAPPKPKTEPESQGTSSWIPWRGTTPQRQSVTATDEPKQSAENLLKDILRDRPPAAPG